jgi:hypothetical protein
MLALSFRAPCDATDLDFVATCLGLTQSSIVNKALAEYLVRYDDLTPIDF